MKAAKFINLVCATVLVSTSVMAQCSTTGSKTAGTVSNNTGIGSISWTGAGNTTTSNNSYATASVSLGILSSATSNYMWASNFGFTIPTGAVICGVVVQVERNAGGLGVGASVTDNTIRLVQGGSIVGNNKASGTSWTGSDVTVSYGATNDLWGSTWTASDFNASNFGVVIAAQFSTGLAALGLSSNIDYVAVTVHYQVLTPVGYKNLSATSIGGSRVSIKWETTYEKDNDVFIIERSNGGSWYAITTLKPAGFNTNGAKYEAIDSFPSDYNEYRIKQVDLNGRYTLSDVVSVRVTDLLIQVVLAPNPSCEFLSLKWNASMNLIQIINQSGLLIKTISVSPNARNTVLSLNSLNKGVYYLKLSSDKRSFVRTFSKL